MPTDEDYTARTVGDLRELLDGVPDEARLRILFDSDYAHSHGVDVFADELPGVLVLSISPYQ
jgi:hypothetical protein